MFISNDLISDGIHMQLTRRLRGSDIVTSSTTTQPSLNNKGKHQSERHVNIDNANVN